MSIHTLSGWGRLACLVVLSHASVAWAEDELVGLSADEAVALALAAHPDIRSADTALGVAKANQAAAALFLNNPAVSAWATPDLRRVSLTASQPISLTGQGWYARSAAKHAVHGAEDGLARTRRNVAAQTRRAWLEAAVASGRVAVAQEGVQLAERLLYGVTRKTEEGEASRLDLHLTRLSQVQATVRLMQAQADQAGALSTLSGWTLSSQGAWAEADPLDAVPTASTDVPSERADVTAARAALASAEANLAQQRAASVPPLSVGIGLQIEDEETFIGPSLAMSVPLFGRNQPARAAAKGQTGVAQAQLDALIATADTEQRTARVRVDEAEALSDVLGEDLLAGAREALSSVEAGVLAGEIDLSTAVLLQTQILDGETAIVNLRGLVASARIDLLLATDDNALLGGAQ